MFILVVHLFLAILTFSRCATAAPAMAMSRNTSWTYNTTGLLMQIPTFNITGKFPSMDIFSTPLGPTTSPWKNSGVSEAPFWNSTSASASKSNNTSAISQNNNSSVGNSTFKRSSNFGENLGVGFKDTMFATSTKNCDMQICPAGSVYCTIPRQFRQERNSTCTYSYYANEGQSNMALFAYDMNCEEMGHIDRVAMGKTIEFDTRLSMPLIVRFRNAVEYPVFSYGGKTFKYPLGGHVHPKCYENEGTKVCEMFFDCEYMGEPRDDYKYEQQQAVYLGSTNITV